MEDQTELFTLIEDMVLNGDPNGEIYEAAVRNVQRACEEFWTWAKFDPKESGDYYSLVAVALIDQARWHHSRDEYGSEEDGAMTDTQTGALADVILAYLERPGAGAVSFHELSQHVKGVKGNRMLMGGAPERCSNICIWPELSSKAIEALQELQRAGRIHMKECHPWIYVYDGSSFPFPIATRIKHYRDMHWYPTVLRAGPFPDEVPVKKRRARR